jgi:outer membrane protein assembly factor BamB
MGSLICLRQLRLTGSSLAPATKSAPRFLLFVCALLALSLFFVITASAAGPTVTLSPTSGPPSTKVLISASGFPASTAVDVYFDLTDEALAVTSGAGTFSGIAILVPASAVPGTHWVTAVARGTTGRAAQASFSVGVNWAQFRYSSLHKGVNPFENVLSTSTVGAIDLHWSFKTGSFIGLSSPAVVNGVVYFGSSDHNLYALDAATGALLWTFATGNSIDSSPAVVNGVVYFGSFDKNVYAINASTGALLWKFTTGSFIASSPAVANGVVYIGSEDNNLYAINASTGIQLWKFATGGVVDSSPAVANGVVYVGSDDANVYAVKASTGVQLWKVPTGSFINSSPAVANGVVYIGSADKNLYAINATTGILLWKFATGNFIQVNSPAVANAVVYIGSDDFSLYAVNAHTGVLVWKYTTGSDLSSSPAVANGVVYVGSFDGNIYAFDARFGTLLWQYPTGSSVESSPAVVNGVVYVGSDDFNLYAFDQTGGTLAKKLRAPERPDPDSLRPNLDLQPSEPVKTIPISETSATGGDID